MMATWKNPLLAAESLRTMSPAIEFEPMQLSQESLSTPGGPQWNMKIIIKN
jgi:hypothetical protein